MAINADSVYSHKIWNEIELSRMANMNIPYPMLSDERGNTVEMWMGKTDININGVATKMDVAPASRNSRTFVPVRFAAENLNCKVDWINSTKEAVIVYEE